MILEWDVHMTVEFPDADIEDIVDRAREEKWTQEDILNAVNEVALGFEDEDYYAWGYDQAMAVMKEINERLAGGIQLSMFNDPFGVPDDYNEGWK